MGRRSFRPPKPPKAKKVSYRLVAQDSPGGQQLYPMLNHLVDVHHRELVGARIALAWNTSWKPDVDGRVTLGKCKKASDLDRELHAYDFVILLRQEFMQSPVVTDAQRRALIDHELCHASVKLRKDGEPQEDDRGRKVYRVVKHDIEEFSAIVARHGCWKRDLEHFAAALRQGPKTEKQRDLFEEPKKPAAQAPAAAAATTSAAAAPESKPSEPHAFQANGKQDECAKCGSNAADPIHGPKSASTYGFTGNEPPDPIVRTHAAISRKGGRGKPKGPLGRKRGKEARA